MVSISLAFFHISIRWYKIQILWLWMSSPKGKSFASALSVNWPLAWMGIKIMILQYWGKFRIDSTEMEMMAALQNLSNNSTQAGLRAMRYICSASISHSMSTTFSLNLCCQWPHLSPSFQLSLSQSPSFRTTLNFNIWFSFSPPPPSDFVHWFKTHKLKSYILRKSVLTQEIKPCA